MIRTVVEIEHIEDFGEQGFYSTTYRANDKRLGREVAVKDIRPKLFKSEEDLEKLFEEAQKLAFASHPRILPVHFVGIHHENDGTGNKDTARIVTKYLKKGSVNGYLKQHYEDGKTITIGQAIRFCHDIIQGMMHLHALDILHLDLKASNVLIGDDDKLVLADFGLSKIIKDETIVEIRELYPVLNPPEVVKNQRGDKTTDIYQFGVLVYSIFNYNIYRKALDEDYKLNTEILSDLFKNGKTEDEEKLKEFKENMKLLNTDIKAGKFPNREEHLYFVPKEVRNIIDKCLKVKVEERYNNFYEIQQDFNKINIDNDVQSLYQSLTDDVIYFTKGEDECKVAVTLRADGKYNILPTKNSQNKPSKAENDISLTKLPVKIYNIVKDL